MASVLVGLQGHPSVVHSGVLCRLLRVDLVGFRWSERVVRVVLHAVRRAGQPGGSGPSTACSGPRRPGCAAQLAWGQAGVASVEKEWCAAELRPCAGYERGCSLRRLWIESPVSSADVGAELSLVIVKHPFDAIGCGG